MTNATKSDAEIQRAVERELELDAIVDVASVGVAVGAGVVTLSGVVDSWPKRVAAQDAAHRVPGVQDVANEVCVRLPGARAQTDTDVAKAVRAGLKWDVRVPHPLIQSAVSNGFVTLEGTVDTAVQREDAERVVRYVKGVLGVTNSITVTRPTVAPSEVRQTILDTLAKDAQRHAKDISIGVADARVTLTGAVGSAAERAAVVRAVEALPGVGEVEDLLRADPLH